MNYKSRSATNLIVVHCSATKPSQDIGVREIDGWHRQLGWLSIGYHYVIRRDGTVEQGRPSHVVGSHVAGKNSDSIGICLIGGISQKTGKAEMNYTEAQLQALFMLVQSMRDAYPNARVVGHRDLSPDKDGDGVVEEHEWLKACPCFNVGKWYAKCVAEEHVYLNPGN